MSMISKRKLGNTGVMVSEIGFGGASVSGEGGGYGFGGISEQDALNLLLKSKDLGVMLYDTAPIYGFSLSEKRIGKAFKNCREDVFIVSKSGVTWDQNKRVDIDNSPKTTLEMLHKSLIDLQTDYIDAYLIHWPDARHDTRYAIEVLLEAREQGKIRFIGLCNSNLSEIEKVRELTNIDIFQSEYSFLSPAVENSIFPHLEGAGFLGWGSFDKGIITGRVKNGRHYDKFDARRSAPWWKKSQYLPKVDFMKSIEPLLEKYNKSGLDLAIQYLLSNSELSSALCGARTIHQLETICESSAKDPDLNFLSEAKDLYDLWVSK